MMGGLLYSEEWIENIQNQHFDMAIIESSPFYEFFVRLFEIPTIIRFMAPSIESSTV